jgi:hypothetical protein
MQMYLSIAWSKNIFNRLQLQKLIVYTCTVFYFKNRLQKHSRQLLACTDAFRSPKNYYTLQMKSNINVWLRFLFPKQNYNVLSPNLHIHVSASDL